MESNYMDYIPIVISLFAVAVSIVTFIKKEKSDQFRIALDIHDKLEKCVNELSKINDKGEIRNKNVIKFFKPSFQLETQRIFQLYPDIANDDEAFGEIKKLLTKLQ